MRGVKSGDLLVGINKLEQDTIFYKKIAVKEKHTIYPYHRIAFYIVQIVVPEGTQYYYDGQWENKVRVQYGFVSAIAPYERFYYSGVSDHSNKIYSKLKHKGWYDAQLKPNLTYKTGEFIYPDRFSRSLRQCASGLHVFINLIKAEGWG